MVDFETQIDRFVVNTEEKLLQVVRTAVSEVVEEAQIPVSGGGRMRVKTGFLRGSGVSSINSLPFGPSKGNRKKTYTWVSDVEPTLAKLEIGDDFYFGWTANYASYREVYDGFLETAVQNWQQHVDNAVRRLKK